MEDRVWWTWLMRGLGGLVRMAVRCADEGEGIPAGAAQQMKEDAKALLELIERKKRDS